MFILFFYSPDCSYILHTDREREREQGRADTLDSCQRLGKGRVTHNGSSVGQLSHVAYITHV